VFHALMRREPTPPTSACQRRIEGSRGELQIVVLTDESISNKAIVRRLCVRARSSE